VAQTLLSAALRLVSALCRRPTDGDERPILPVLVESIGYRGFSGKRFMGDTDRPSDEKNARVLLCVYREHLVALHGFIKKTRKTPDGDLALARKRQKELEQ
jgi:hypothetical protein